MRIDKSEAVGFFFVLFITLSSIDDMCEWIWSLASPQWVKILGVICALALWITGLAYLYEAEKAMIYKRRKEQKDE